MKKGMILGFLVFVLCLSWAGGSRADDAETLYPIMKPDWETVLRWIESYETAPRAYIDAARDFSKDTGGSLSLLSHLNYIPSQRLQGSCGDCWAWAGTGVLEIALDVQEGIHERLSVQYVNSCTETERGYACCGGWLNDIVELYAASGKAIPWSNTNASFQDGSRTCEHGSSLVACGSISTSPSYGIDAIVRQTIPTQVVGQTTAIANIKNVLNQQKAIWFAFMMGTQEDWNRFRSFWRNEPENVLWSFDSTCGKPWIEGEGAGHAVLCVGYNDDDPANAYWIMLNSWGTTAGRPTGLFRVAMDMNYDCAYSKQGQGYYSLFFQTLDVSFQTGQTVYVDRAGTCNGFTPCSSTIQGAIGIAATGDTIKIAGGAYPEDVSLDADKNLTFKGGYNSTYSTQTMETVCRNFTIGKGTAVMDKMTVADTPAADVASVAFYNNLISGQDPFTAIFTLGGHTFTSFTGHYSMSEEVVCGRPLSWTAYANTERGEIVGSGAHTLTCDCLYEIWVTADESSDVVTHIYATCPGDCADVQSPQIGERQLLDCVRVSKDGNRGFEAVQPLILKKGESPWLARCPDR